MSLGLELVGDIRAVLPGEVPERPPATVAKLRASHHQVARLVAKGQRFADICAITGYSLSRLSALQHDPSFMELVAHYAAQHEEVIAAFEASAEALARDAMQVVHDRVLDEPDAINTLAMVEIAKFGAAHAGLGPVTRSFAVNVTKNYGDKLDAANARRAKLAVGRDGIVNESIAVGRKYGDERGPE